MTRTIVRIAPNHPAFAGHFPGHPVIPAALLLAEVMAAVEAATSRPAQAWCVANAKFVHAAGPDCELALVHEPLAGGRLRFELRSGNRIISSGELAPA